MRRFSQLLLLFPALSARAEPLRLHAAVEAGDLRIEAEAPLPEAAFIRIQVFRDVATFAGHPPVPLADVRVPFTSPDRLEALIPMGEAFAVPGHYRVRGEFERTGQYPGVLESIGSLTLDAAEIRLLVGMDSEAFLAKVIKEQAFLDEALAKVTDFLARLEGFQAAVAADPATGIPAWQAWRDQTRPFLETLILRGREEVDRCYPETYHEFAESFIFHGIFQTESRAFMNAGTGKPVIPTGPLRDGGMGPDRLTPYRALFQREILHYRLAGADALILALRTEVAAQRKAPDRARWFRRRALWGRHLELLGTALEPLPQREALIVLLKAVTTWVEAEEKVLFDQGPPAKGAETSVQEALVPLRKALLERGKP